jgi:uncharacterized membrane protein
MSIKNFAALVTAFALVGGSLQFANASDTSSAREAKAWHECRQQIYGIWTAGHNDFDRQRELSMQSCLADHETPYGAAK